jgi:hypothetical protein
MGTGEAKEDSAINGIVVSKSKRLFLEKGG